MMKNWLMLLLVTLLLSVAVPALAQETSHDCPHDGPTIAELLHCVELGVSAGHIDNTGIANSLFAKLDAAQAALDRGQPAQAINVLGALANQVAAQKGKHIDAQHADHMLSHIQRVVDWLGA